MLRSGYSSFYLLLIAALAFFALIAEPTTGHVAAESLPAASDMLVNSQY